MNNASSLKTFNTDKTGTKRYFNSDGHFHREDGPAIEYKDGRKEWYKDGIRHREDGPAIESPYGINKWYLNNREVQKEDLPNFGSRLVTDAGDGAKRWYNSIDEHHRLDGPAIEYANGDKEWWQNGKLHRTNGPAIELSNGHKEWYVRGKKITPKPSIIKPQYDLVPQSYMQTEVGGTKRWRNHLGQEHRTDGPAIECVSGDKFWYQNGKLHREDGPAIVYANGGEAWYKHGNRVLKPEDKMECKIDSNGNKHWVNDKGQLHRSKGPAIEWANGSKYWYKNGKRHRRIGPAVMHPNGHCEYYINDQLHRDNGPAINFGVGSGLWYRYGMRLSGIDVPKIDDNGVKRWFNNEGKLHRIGLPAVIFPSGREEYFLNGERHNINGPAIFGPAGHESYFVCGKLHRCSGPAIIDAEGNKQWFFEGKLHCSNGPASIYQTGEKRWYKHGILHRTDGPAHVMANGNEFWYKNGKYHREGGPAVILSSGEKQYWVNGHRLPAAVMSNSKKRKQSTNIVLPEKLKMKDCPYCGNEAPLDCPFCKESAKYLCCPKCRKEMLYKQDNAVVCLNAGCSSIWTPEAFESAIADKELNSELKCPLCGSKKLSTDDSGMACLECETQWFPDIDEPTNSQDELLQKHWKRTCPKCQCDQQVARLVNGQFHCIACSAEWKENSSRRNKTKPVPSASDICSKCGDGYIVDGRCVSCHCSNDSITCIGCRTTLDLDDIVISTTCKECHRVIPLPKSILNRKETKYSNVYDLLTPDQASFALNMFRMIPEMDSESFNKALRYLRREEVFSQNLSALMDGINGLKNELGQHCERDWFDETFSDLEDQLQELSEAQEYVDAGSDSDDDEEGEDYDDNESNEDYDFQEANACGYDNDASYWNGDIWSDRRSRMNFNKVGYSDVTIEEVDSSDLLTNETYESHDSDEQFLCQD